MNTRRSKAGFTLIEIMVVVIIIAALATMVLPRVLPASDEAKRNISKGDKEISAGKMADLFYEIRSER